MDQVAQFEGRRLSYFHGTRGIEVPNNDAGKKVPESTLAVSQRARVREEVRHHARRTAGKVDPNSHKPSSRLSKTPYYRRWRSRFEREGQAFLSFQSARSTLPLGQSSPSPNNKEAKSPELRTVKQHGIGMYEIHLSCGFVVVFS